MNEFESCMEKNLLRRIPAQPDKIEKSILKADDFLKKAVRSFEDENFDGALIFGYLSMFHAAKSILFKDGWREKSHYCVARYLEEKYAKTGKLEMIWIHVLDRFRDLRNDDQYDVDFFASKRDAEEAIENANGFINAIKKFLKL